MKKIFMIIAVVTGVFSVFFFLLGNEEQVNFLGEDYWAAVRQRDIAYTSDDWGEPQLATFSTPGWEEGVFVSASGNEVYYIYTNYDVFNQKESWEILDTQDSCTHPYAPAAHACGGWPRADHFFVTKQADGSWSTPEPYALTLDWPIGGLHLVGEDSAYFMSAFQDEYDTIEDIGYAKRNVDGSWGPKTKLDVLSSLEFNDSDPWVNDAETEIFFWSDRPAKFGMKNIYRAEKINGEWQKPELLPEPINSNGEDMQTFIFDDYLYFSSDRGETDGKLAIWRSKRLGVSEWDEPELVISSNIAVGEPTITADGKYLFFEQIFADESLNFNPDIMYVEAK